MSVVIKKSYTSAQKNFSANQILDSAFSIFFQNIKFHKKHPKQAQFNFRPPTQS